MLFRAITAAGSAEANWKVPRQKQLSAIFSIRMREMSGYICPVCGYNMQDPPEDYNICPSCGTEFGIHDVNSSIEELRASWLGAGAPWWSTFTPVPPAWNPNIQLLKVLVSTSAFLSHERQSISGHLGGGNSIGKMMPFLNINTTGGMYANGR